MQGPCQAKVGFLPRFSAGPGWLGPPHGSTLCLAWNTLQARPGGARKKHRRKGPDRVCKARGRIRPRGYPDPCSSPFPGLKISVRALTVRHSARAAATLLLTALLVPAGARAQATTADSVRLLEEAREAQVEFERLREERTPLQEGGRPGGVPAGVCDEHIGRICIWYGGAEEENVPGELRETQQTRVELIRLLFDAQEQIKDRWVLGQLVHYLVEARQMAEAERVATECGISEAWWCTMLRGYTLHVATEYIEAEAAFREGLAAMPEATREEWTSPRYIFPPDAREAFDRQPVAERERLWELFWRLSDPLFLFEGNDRLTDHFARWVVAMNRRQAADPLGLEWGEDLEETLIRYGRNTGYSRTREAPTFGRGLVDNRRMTGHHHPKSRGYLFPERFLESPSDIPPESWITAPREARTWHAPLYAPDVRALETQVGRFRRDEQMLVVGAYRPTLETEDGRNLSAWRPEGGIEGTPHAALFLVDEYGQEPVFVRGDDPEGVITMLALPGRYVSGLEVVDLEGRQAWRARQGVVQLPLAVGQVDVSDLMILREGALLPASLDAALPHLRPGVRLRVGERFPVVWEVYGLRIQEPVRVTIGFTRGRPGFLERAGEFLGVIEPEQPVEITFEDQGPDVVQSIFRAVEIELPDLEPGDYTLHLRLDLAGRTPLVISRPIVVEG